MLKIKKLNNKGFAHFVVPIFIIMIVAVAGSYMIVRSRAAPTLPRITGYMDWNNSSKSKTSNSVKITATHLCVSTKFESYKLNSSRLLHAKYHWTIHASDGYRWKQVYKSPNFTANKNEDRRCTYGLKKGGVYRVKFVPESGLYMRGTYTVTDRRN
jgi:hypothetical protein